MKKENSVFKRIMVIGMIIAMLSTTLISVYVGYTNMKASEDYDREAEIVDSIKEDYKVDEDETDEESAEDESDEDDSDTAVDEGSDLSVEDNVEESTDNTNETDEAIEEDTES